MLVLLCEDDSDVMVLRNILAKITDPRRVTIKGKAYEGCGDLRRKALRDIKLFQTRGFNRFVVCHDADGPSAEELRSLLDRQIRQPSGLGESLYLAIPVQEMEAWLLSDEAAVNRAVPKFRFRGHSNPEAIESPKEWLIRASRNSGGKPLYSPSAFNPEVARHLDVDKVAGKCRSFSEFVAVMRGWLAT